MQNDQPHRSVAGELQTSLVATFLVELHLDCDVSLRSERAGAPTSRGNPTPRSIYVAQGGDVITWSIQTMNCAKLPDM